MSVAPIQRATSSLPCSFSSFPGAALAAMSLAEALKQEDAKYLDAPDVTAKDDAPKIEAGGGEEGQAPKPQEIGQGAVKAALSYTEAKGDDGEVTRDADHHHLRERQGGREARRRGNVLCRSSGKPADRRARSLQSDP